MTAPGTTKKWETPLPVPHNMKKILVALAFGSLLASCVPSTPQTRIQQNPEKFSALRESDRALVQQGKITRGMPRDAVYLAWGRPSDTFQGSRDGEISERWDYAGTRPVYTTGFYGAYGYGTWTNYMNFTLP